MKRLFGKKEKERPQQPTEQEKPKPSSSFPTRSDTVQGVVHANNVASNGTLSSHVPSTAHRKSSFFSVVTRGSSSSSKTTMSTSGSASEAGSAPLTASSISGSGSSNASSSAASTRIDEPAGPNAVETTTPAVDEKVWPNWMNKSIGKGKAKKLQQHIKSTASSFSNLSRSSTYAGLGAAFHASQRGNNSAANGRRPSNLESSEGSELSDDSSWDELDDDDEGTSTAPNIKNLRVPASGRQRRHTPHQSGQSHARSVFRGNAVAAPLSRETSKALANLHALTIDALVPPTTSPPLVQTSSSIPFPKSSNRTRLHGAISCTSQTQHSPLHTEILRKRLLRRMERRVLTASEQASIQPLATRTPRPKDADKRKLPASEETYEDSKAVGGGWSKGMKRWAMRPCFEERTVVWKAVHSGVIVTSVERDSRCGVAALEFSEGAEALAGLHRQNELPPPPSDIYVPASNRKLPPPLVIPRSQNGMNSSLGAASARGRIHISSRLRPTTAVESSTMDEDDLPLGVVMMHRRHKEEGEERKRRAAAERVERERKVHEEEERRRKYAEEVAAARARREAEKSRKPGTKDAWLAGDADALPPPIKPFASHLKSSSNPNLSSSNSTPIMAVSTKPPVPRRQTTGTSSSASSFVTSTTATPRQESPHQLTFPPIPPPWAGMPMAGTPPASQYDFAGGSLSGMPMSAPVSQLHYPASMMMLPPHPDPVSMAMFEQGLLRPWAMDVRGSGSTGTLTPPRPLFGFASSGDSSGSLTPPRFPNSRPSSWGSSSEDVRNALQRNGSTVGSRSGVGNNVDSQEWRQSRNSALVTPEDNRRSRSYSKSPIEQPASPWAEHNTRSISPSVSSPLRSSHKQQSSAHSNISSKSRPSGTPSVRPKSVISSAPPLPNPNPYGLSTGSSPLSHPGVVPRKSSTQATLKETTTTQRKSRLFS